MEAGLEEVVVDFDGVEVVGRLGGIEAVRLCEDGREGLESMGGMDCEVAIDVFSVLETRN